MVLDWLNEVERVFEFLNLAKKQGGEATGYKIEGVCFLFVPANADDKSPI